MNCPNCQVSISEEQHRCQNCGRRLGASFSPVLAMRTATALKLDPVANGPLADGYEQQAPPPSPRLEYSNDAAPRSAPRHLAAMQGSLFSLRDTNKVQTIDGHLPAATGSRRARRQPQAQSSYLPYQGVLEFPTPAPARTLATSVDAVIYCDYPVATRTHRLLGGLVDFVIVLACMMLFLGILYVGCEGLPWFSLDMTTLALVGVATGLLGLFYEAFWLMAGAPSPGMECVGLRLVHFDGNELTRKDHTRRIFGGVLSMLAAFVGLAWAFVDEECLTWQDHISRTFPTPVRAQYGSRR